MVDLSETAQVDLLIARVLPPDAGLMISDVGHGGLPPALNT